MCFLQSTDFCDEDIITLQPLFMLIFVAQKTIIYQINILSKWILWCRYVWAVISVINIRSYFQVWDVGCEQVGLIIVSLH